MPKDGGLDIRPLLKTGDMYILDDCLSTAGDVFMQGKSCNILKYGLNLINAIVQSGN